jgi:hypothetical protein
MQKHLRLHTGEKKLEIKGLQVRLQTELECNVVGVLCLFAIPSGQN